MFSILLSLIFHITDENGTQSNRSSIPNRSSVFSRVFGIYREQYRIA